METQARYVVVGLFAVAVIAAGFGFVFWLNNAGGLSERTVYRVRFKSSVSGLLTGSSVLFNGIRVGEVTDLALNPDNPQEVDVTIAVAKGTPVRADSHVGMEFQGLTGSPTIALSGGTAAAALVTGTAGEPAVLTADNDAGQTMTQAAREALQRLNKVLDENSAPLKKTIASLEAFSDALGRNSDKVDGILAGLERMTAPAAPPPVSYDLAAPDGFPPLEKQPSVQLAVPEATADAAHDTQRILVQADAGEVPGFAGSQWSDSLPNLFQAENHRGLRKRRLSPGRPARRPDRRRPAPDRYPPLPHFRRCGASGRRRFHCQDPRLRRPHHRRPPVRGDGPCQGCGRGCCSRSPQRGVRQGGQGPHPLDACRDLSLPHGRLISRKAHPRRVCEPPTA